MVVTIEQHALLMAWIFAVGGCVGSFLNVVIYRIPAGLSIVSPGSRCPKCLTPIRARDNVPILKGAKGRVTGNTPKNVVRWTVTDGCY